MALDKFTLHSLHQVPKVLDYLQFSIKKCLVTFIFNLEFILLVVDCTKGHRSETVVFFDLKVLKGKKNASMQ